MLSETCDDDASRRDVNQDPSCSLPRLTGFVQKHSSRKKTRPKTQSDILKMLETEPSHKDNLSPFNPLPAIGHRNQTWEDRLASTEFKKQIKSGKEIHFKNINNHFVVSVNNFDGKLQSGNYTNRQFLQSSGRKLNDLKMKTQQIKFTDINNNKDETVSHILQEIKSNRSKDYQRQYLCRHFESTNVDNLIDLNHSVSQKIFPAKEESPPKVANKESDHTAKVIDRSFKIETSLERALTDDEQPPITESHQLDLCNPTLALGSNIFQKRVKLLERRKRESFAKIDDKALKDLQEHMELKSKAKNESKELDYSSSSDGESGSALPKISHLVGILNNTQISKRRKGRVKMTNNWF